MRRSQRIQRILHIREQQEEAARAAWLAAQREAEARELDAQAGQARFRAGQEALRQALLQPDPSQILWAQRTVDAQQNQAITLSSVARRVAQAAEARRAPWVQARQTVKAMERLWERADRLEQQARREREAQEQAEAIEAHMAQKNAPSGETTDQPVTLDDDE